MSAQVSLHMLLLCAGYQSLLLVPTGILAQQHLHTLRDLVSRLPPKMRQDFGEIVLLSSGLKVCKVLGEGCGQRARCGVAVLGIKRVCGGLKVCGVLEAGSGQRNAAKLEHLIAQNVWCWWRGVTVSKGMQLEHTSAKALWGRTA